VKLSEFYKKAISTGMENDPRGKEAVLRDLERKKKDYENLKPEEKELFDIESLDNPYLDSKILYGNGDGEIRDILVGIDIEVGEVILAETLKNKNTNVDVIVSRHP